MCSRPSLATIAGPFAFLPVVAVAATVKWTMTDVPLLTLVSNDFEGTLSRIQAVALHVEGYGGGQHGRCAPVGSPEAAYEFWLPFEMTLEFEGRAAGMFNAPLRAPYVEDPVVQTAAGGLVHRQHAA